MSSEEPNEGKARTSRSLAEYGLCWAVQAMKRTSTALKRGYQMMMGESRLRKVTVMRERSMSHLLSTRLRHVRQCRTNR